MSCSTAGNAWETCLTLIANQVPKQSFRTWFARIKPLELDEGVDPPRLRLAVPDPFHTEWLESHFPDIVRQAAREALGRKAHVVYEVAPEMYASGTSDEAEEDAPPKIPRRTLSQESPASVLSSNDVPMPLYGAPAPARWNGAPAPARWNGAPVPLTNGTAHRPTGTLVRTTGNMRSRLKPEYTFESFIEGDSNRLVRSAALAIAKNPGGTSFNPFMVYGGVGLGKTHIVQAVGNHVEKEREDLRTLYVSSEQFTSQFVRAIQENRVPRFSHFYRRIDLLIIDDVQFFAGKEKTQEEFFHVFNELHQTGRQIILCADRSPSEIAGIEDRLLSRFKWGLSADIQIPDLETRIAILKHKAAKRHVSLKPEVIHFVAERIRTNIRHLEGALLKLVAHAELYHQDIDLCAAKDILRDMIEDYQVQPEIEEIQCSIAQYYGISAELLSEKTRKREIVIARHMAMYFCKELTAHSLKSIGLRFGGRDHSTVIHAYKTIENRMELEAGFRENIQDIRRHLERHTSNRPGRTL